MARKFYVRTMRAGRYFKSVRYQRAMPHDTAEARAAKALTTNKAQRYINLKNAAERLQMLLCANFDDKAACFCTFTFNDENLPVNRKMARQYFTAFITSLRRKWKRKGRELPYIYALEGVSLDYCSTAIPIDNIEWEIRPWKAKEKWDSLDTAPGKKANKKKEYDARFHIHCFLILSKADRKIVEDSWPYGISYLNPMWVDDPKTFERLSYYVTKEARNGVIKAGCRSYVPSCNLVKPKPEGHWGYAHEVFEAPPWAEHIKHGKYSTEYTSYEYISYWEPRPKKAAKSYKSKGRL